MTIIESSTLNIDADLGRLNPEAVPVAWRQAHFAAQAAAELGESWALAQADDSHSSFGWARAEHWRGIEGVPATGPKPYRARMSFEGLQLRIDDGRGRTVDRLALPGRTLNEALEWVAATGRRELGPPRQPSRPAPDLPEHPLAEAAPFEDVPNGLSSLAVLYDATARMLAKLRERVPAFDDARCWPHHFDLASLAVLARDDAGALAKTVGVGITPPDPVEPAGYWYVSPWVTEGVTASADYPRLSAGRWLDRGGGLSMAMLPVSELSSAQDRWAALGTFIAEAGNACVEVLDV